MTVSVRATLMIAAIAVAASAARGGELAAADAPALPEFTQHAATQWLNSKPLTVADLKGRVVLLEFWAFDCVNCYQSIPWLHAMEQRYSKDGLRLLGIHTPELPQERVRDNVLAKLRQFSINNPVMLDDDYGYWQRLGNKYWPAFYLIDREARIRALYVGETHVGDARAVGMEQAIVRLLKEPAPSASTRVSAATE